MVVVVQLEPLAPRGISGRGQCDDRRPRSLRTEKAPRLWMAVCEGGDQRPQMPGKVGLVDENQAVCASHGGVDRPSHGAVPAKQQTRTVHRHRAQDDGRPRGIRRSTRGDAAPQTDYVQRPRGGIDPERTKPFGDALDGAAPGRVQLRGFRVVEHARDVPGVLGRRIHKQAPVDDPPDARRRGTAFRCSVRLRSQPPHGDVETGRLAESCLYSDLVRPLPPLSRSGRPGAPATEMDRVH